MKLKNTCVLVVLGPGILLAQSPVKFQDASPHQLGAERVDGKTGSAAIAAPAVLTTSLLRRKNSSLSTAVFIENAGQFDPRVRYQVKLGGQTAWLTAGGVVFDATRPAKVDKPPAPSAALLDLLSPLPRFDRAKPKLRTMDRLVFAEDFAETSCCTRIEGREPRAGIYNYFEGRDPAKWRTNVRGFAEVVYRDLWPGIDLRVYGHGPDLEQEFIVRPGGDLSRVQVAYRGIDKLSISGDGSLEIATAFGVLRETKPRIYQQIANKREAVEGRYKLISDASYAFDVQSHDTTLPLVIDPTLLYSTFLGGSAGNGFYGYYNSELATGIAVDASGNAYVAGNTASSDFPITTGAFQTSPPACCMSFITKLNATGSALVYSTYLGDPTYLGGGIYIYGIAVDTAGNAYVTGLTGSTYYGHVFPTTANAYWPTNSAQQCTLMDFFVTEFNPTGNQLMYSSCFNISGNAAYVAEYGYYPRAMAVDSAGRAYVAGGAGAGLPTTANAYQPLFPGARQSGFVMVLDTTASGPLSLVYSSYLGVPTAVDNFGASASAITVDSFGKMYVTGSAFAGFPTTAGAFQPSHSSSPSSDTFIAKLDPSVSSLPSLIYSTYLSGPANCAIGCGAAGGSAIAVDPSGNAYVTGSTQGNLPVTSGAFQTAPPFNLGGGNVSFVTKLNAGGSKLLYSTYLESTCTDEHACGSGSITTNGIALDPAGEAYVTGSTNSGMFPVTADAFQGTYGKSSTNDPSAFLTKLNSTGSALIYSSYLEGSLPDVAMAIAIDQTGDAYVAGFTASPTFPTTPTAFQPALNLGGGTSPQDAFVTKFPLAVVQTISISSLTPTSGGNAGTATLSIQGGGFHNGAAINLVGGTTIAGTAPTVGAEGRTISATFDLTGAPVGSYALVVVNPDGTTATLPSAFTVEQGGDPNLRICLTGLAVSHGRTNSVVNVIVSNTGSVDSPGGVVLQDVIPGFSLTSVSPSGAAGLTTLSADSEVAWALPPLSAGSSQVLVSTATTVGAIGSTFSVPSASFTPNSEVFSAFVCLLKLMGTRAAGVALDTLCAGECIVTAPTLGTAAPACLACILGAIASAKTLLNECAGVTQAAISSCLNQGATSCSVGNSSAMPSVAANNGPVGLDCAPSPEPVVFAMDPNSLVGPPGVAGQRWIGGKPALTYGISFSNEPTAPLPAQQVVVTQPLGANVNPNTLTLLGINLPNGTSSVQVPVPAGSFNPGAAVNEFTTVADFRPAQSLLVNVDAKLNPATRTLTWTLGSIDPATGAPPVNPLIGFLPPGAGASVFFTVTPVAGIATGTQISDQAAVVFDGNAPLWTAAWVITIDDSPPTSQVASLPATQACPNFKVPWSGSDVGSGVQGITIFVSDNGSPFVP